MSCAELAKRIKNGERFRIATLSEELRIEACLEMFTKRQPTMMREAADKIDKLSADLSEAVAALKELVRLKALKDAYEHGDINDLTMRRDYDENKPLAWKAARSIVARME